MLYMDFSRHYVTSSASFNSQEDALKKRHHSRLNVAFADGSIRPILYDDIPPQVPRLGPGTASFWYGLTEQK